MEEDFIPLATGIIFLVIGIICLFYSKKVQKYALDFYDRHKTAGALNPFLDWMKTQSYILSLRIIGLVGIAVFILTLVVFIVH
jgi:uncharacterized protein YjeT (DUF2065 family)